MTKNQIEHMWKVASNNPNHDTNWHDPVVEAFAKLVAVHTVSNIDPSSFMSYQEGYEAGKQAAREAILDLVDGYAKNNTDLAEAIRARGLA